MNKKELSQKIFDTLNYFVEDPSRRCISDGGMCYYSAESVIKESPSKDIESNGCAVGMHLTLEDRLIADQYLKGHSDTSAGYLIDHRVDIGITIPDFICDHPEIWDMVQGIHDSSTNWNKDGLTEGGKQDLIYLIYVNELDQDIFTPLLKDREV